MSDDQTNASYPKPSVFWLAPGAVALAAGALIMVSAEAGPATGESTAPRDASPLVEVAAAEAAPRSYIVSAPGRLRARQELALVSEVSGKVTTIHPELEIGGRVAKGDILVRLDSGDFVAERERAAASLATAEARLSAATSEKARQEQLVAIGATPEALAEQAIATFEDAVAAVRQAEAQLALAERALAKTLIRAPFDAIVVSEMVSIGTYVSPGFEFAQLMDSGAAELVAGLSPNDVAGVRAAFDAAEGELSVVARPNEGAVGSAPLDGYLDDFSPMIDALSRTVSVVAVFPDAFSEANEGLVFADDFMTLEINTLSSEPLWRVPEGAVRQDSFVWVVDEDSRMERRAIRVLERGDGSTVITSPGSLDGVSVVVTPLAEESDGLRIRVADRN